MNPKIQHRIFMVDVFAEKPWSGNPLAVIVSDKELPTGVMQHIAAETNFSETTFIRSEPEASGAFSVRIFTPAREIRFTGHPILGTAWVIRNHIINNNQDPVHLNTAIGTIRVSFENDSDGSNIVWFEAPNMTIESDVPKEFTARSLGLTTADIDSNLPVQVVSAGTSAMIVPLCNADALARSQLNLQAFEPLAAQGLKPLIYVFCRQPQHPGNDFRVRFFFEAHGVREDPATGNGAAFLGAYLLAQKTESNFDQSMKIEQGFELRRPSLIRMHLVRKNNKPIVRIGGSVIPTVVGELAI
ncbi:MAG: trans-2,3-dihydro-3-hydroxyanthranilate isomerase [Gammaproteobacteria bacterium]|jgi:trans-2,3-dihydro-3-hydroxyanthranilate isomerase